jgi:uncharacterized phage-associated protein
MFYDMLEKYQSFNIEKVVQATSYLQRNLKDSSKIHILKFLFFADRYNIRKHFNFITLDTYYAMRYGPVASQTYNLLSPDNHDKFDNCSEDDFKIIHEFVKVKSKTTVTLTNTNTDLLSRNEMASLDFAIQTFRGKDVVEISHDYPEWSKYRERFENKLTCREDIDIDDFFKNPIMSETKYLKTVFDNDPMYEDEGYLIDAKKFYHRKSCSALV